MVKFARFFVLLLLTVSIAACSGMPGKNIYGDVKGFMVDVVTFEKEDNVEHSDHDHSSNEEHAEVTENDDNLNTTAPAEETKEVVEDKEDHVSEVKVEEHKHHKVEEHTEVKKSDDTIEASHESEKEVHKSDDHEVDIRFGTPDEDKKVDEKPVIAVKPTVKKEESKKLELSDKKTVVINKRKLKFTPSKLVIKAGETVTWVNNDTQKHNFVSITGPDGAFDEPEIFHLAPPGDVWSYTFYDPGEYQYYCFIHSRMKGEIIVLPED